MYKSIMVGNHERTREVIRNAMMKHGLEGSPDNYTLSQLLPDKGNRICLFLSGLISRFFFLTELLIPDKANVYYAVSTQHDLNFVLREKPEDLNASLASGLDDPSSQQNSTPKSGFRKGSRDASKARRKLLGLQI